MRILFTFVGGRGHAEPLAPIGTAAVVAGHEIAMASAGEAVPAIRAAGITAFATREPLPARPESAQDEPLEPVDTEPDLEQLRKGFALRQAREHASAVQKIAREWKPDIIVRDEMDFGSAIAAEVLGLPSAAVLVLAAGTFLRKDVIAEPLQEIRAEHGLPADRELTMLERDLVLSPFPAGFRSPAARLPPTAFSYRGFDPAPPPAPTPTPTVYFTLGTVYTNLELMTRVVAGLAEVQAEVVVTVGQKVDPARLGPLPRHIRVEQFIPQTELLPRCHLMISHAGSGSVMGALAHGVPSILLPMGADQPDNARRCAELGVGRVLDPATVTPAQIRDAVSDVLADPEYRRAADRLRTEISALPGPEHTVPLLESLAAR
jgi:UDP:flavonoid glycosyltransferase YjiC (YdhE family)